ncbi:hypothetical protein ABZ354_07495 [Streptomyces sp. NPDC005925]|uniref:hypothetical protein n=1 Tax=Streptomyces sp. NPDC005925 TaxID=3157172 RepID=UPI003409A157
MRNPIARALAACLRSFLAVVLPARGRHRLAPGWRKATPTVPAAPAPPAAPLPRSPYAAYNAEPESLTGEQVRLIRPYLTAHERAVQARVKRAAHERITREHRLAAALTTPGVDIGPDATHGGRIPA